VGFDSARLPNLVPRTSPKAIAATSGAILAVEPCIVSSLLACSEEPDCPYSCPKLDMRTLGATGDEASDLRQAAVHLEVGAIDLAGLIGGKKCHDIGDFVGFRVATKRHEAPEVIVEALQVSARTCKPIKPRSYRRTWADCVHAGPFHIVVIILQYDRENQTKRQKPTFISSTRTAQSDCVVSCRGVSYTGVASRTSRDVPTYPSGLKCLPTYRPRHGTTSRTTVHKY
jgi:hypothetical protein